MSTTPPLQVPATDLAGEVGRIWWSYRWHAAAIPAVVAAVAFGIAGLLPPSFTAKASLLPQQQGGGGQNAMAALVPLVGLTAQGTRNSAEQFVALMQSVALSDRIVDRFDLLKVYDHEFREQARQTLAGHVRMIVGRKDGLVYIEVDDRDPRRAADMANAYVDELQAMVGKLAFTEAKQRRVFFESQLKQTRDNLTKAQIALQGSGFTQGAMKADSKIAAEEYAKLKADVMAAEVRVQTMRIYMNEAAPDMKQAVATLDALRAQLARRESAAPGGAGSPSSDYITKYRDFKYQENLFDLFSRQYELARVDESRDGLPVQSIDVATPPERPSGPRKARIALSAGGTALILIATYVTGLTLRVRRRWSTQAAGSAG